MVPARFAPNGDLTHCAIWLRVRTPRTRGAKSHSIRAAQLSTTSFLSQPRRMRIVIIEDHLIIREAVRHACVHNFGHEVVAETEFGAAGVQLASRLKPD